MARAEEVLAGATLTVEDDRRDYGEDRFITIGFLDGAMVVLVWTPRPPKDTSGVISMTSGSCAERKRSKRGSVRASVVFPLPSFCAIWYATW